MGKEVPWINLRRGNVSEKDANLGAATPALAMKNWLEVQHTGRKDASVDHIDDAKATITL